MSVIKPSINTLKEDFLKEGSGPGLSFEDKAKKLREAAAEGRDSHALAASKAPSILEFLPSSFFKSSERTPISKEDAKSQFIAQKPNAQSDPWSQFAESLKAANGAFGDGGSKRTFDSNAGEQAKQAIRLALVDFQKQTRDANANGKNGKIDIMGINKDDIQYGQYGEGHGAGSHGGDPEGSTRAGADLRDNGADSFMSWALSGAKSPEQASLLDRVNFKRELSDQLDRYQDGQGIANLGQNTRSGLSERDWFELARTQGDQFISLAYSRAEAQGQKLSPAQARATANEMLGQRSLAYTGAGIKDGNLIGILIGKGLSTQDFKNNPEEQQRYSRYLEAKSGNYDWSAMQNELSKNGISSQEMRTLENISGIDRRDQNLFAENLNYESYMNLHKLGNDLNYFKDKAIGFNLIFATSVEGDHNGALHMNHGSLTGLASGDKNPTIILSPGSDEDMKRMLFRLAFVPKDTAGVNGFEWLGRSLNQEEGSLLKMLGNTSLSVQERTNRFNQYLDANGLEKNVGIANYMLKGHGWGGGIQLHDRGTFDNADKDVMALMGLGVSANVDQARVHQQSCSTAVGGENSNIGVGNNTMNDFAPATTKVVSVGANDIHWNGQGEQYQYVTYVNGTMVNEGQITEKQYYARMGLRENYRPEELASMSQFTKNEDGITVKKENPSDTDTTDTVELASR